MLAKILNRIRQSSPQPVDSARTTALAAATLMLEVAWADHDFEEAEIAIVRATLRNTFGLTDDETGDIVEESKRHHDESVGLFAFTKTINDSWDESRKFQLITQMWSLAFADGQIDRFEEHMIRKIAELLYVSHTRYIQAKQLARSERSQGTSN